MRRLTPWTVAGVLAGACLGMGLVMTGCKDPEQVAQAKKVRTAADQVNDGKRLMGQGRADLALPEFKAAAGALPADPEPQLLIAQAQRDLGNDGAAILALKQALELTHGDDASIKKQLAEALRMDGHVDEAIAFLLELRADKLLTDHELLQLARLQGRSGDFKGGFATLEEIQRARPDDPDAKVIEAELLMLSGQKDLGLKILERLVADNPLSIEVRALRARSFLADGDAEKAQAELNELPKEAMEDPELALLEADVLFAQEKFEEADSKLGAVLERRPRDPEVLSRLAEVKLNLGAVSTADMLVEQSMGVRPRSPRGLYMRGRIMEAQGDGDQALDFYNQALNEDPGFFAALGHSWKIHKQKGETSEAMSDLERLLFMNRASMDEKVALAELYAQSKTQVARGQKLIAEAIEKDPKSDRLREIQKTLGKAAPVKKKAPQVEMIVGGKRRR